MRRKNAQTFRVEKSHTVYQGDQIRNKHTKFIVLHTMDFVYVVVHYKLILIVFFIKYIWVLSLFWFRLVYLKNCTLTGYCKNSNVSVKMHPYSVLAIFQIDLYLVQKDP